MPAAERVSITELSSGENSYRRVEAQGVVGSGRRENDGRLTLNVVTAGGTFQARVTATGLALVDGFVDSTVRIRGVANTTFNRRGEAIRFQVLVSSPSDIEVTAPGASAAPSASAHAVKPLLRRVSDIRRLSPAEARRGYPVQLRAVVTTTTSVNANVFIQDATAGIYMVNGGDRLEAGQLVEVAGQTGSGDFAPIVDKVRVRVIGRSEMPEPLRVASERPVHRPVRQSVRGGGRALSRPSAARARAPIFQSSRDRTRSGHCWPISATARCPPHSWTRRSEFAGRVARSSTNADSCSAFACRCRDYSTSPSSSRRLPTCLRCRSFRSPA